MEAAAIYHGMEKRYCYALEPGQFLIRIKTKKQDILHVTLHTVDKYIPINYMDTRQSTPMQKVASDEVCDYYEAVLSIDVVCLRYFFELEDNCGVVLYYGNYRFHKELITNNDDMFDCPQNLREEERFVVPKWAANQVVYQIFPSRFATTKEYSEEEWYQTPIAWNTNLPGNLPGITDKLPYLRELGVDVIYLTPIFTSNSSHKYDTIDYLTIDPAFGTKEDLQHLVHVAHELGLKVILDAVFNHTSKDFFAFRDILEHGEESPYLDWYYIDSFPLQSEWGQRPSYKTFSYFGGMPKLNLKNPQVEAYLFDVIRYWMRSCHIDGWRLDVGDEISHNFWKKFRRVVKEENPEALIIGEIWHLANDFLEGDEWDTVMNYDFRMAILDFVAYNKITPSQFAERFGFLRGNNHTHVYPLLWNLIDSHDTERILHSCSENLDKMKLAVAIQLLSTGMPMIYYGDEYGMTGGHDPDCRRGMLWSPKHQNQNMWSWYHRLLILRKSYPILTEGEITDLTTDDALGLICITKEKDGKLANILFNNSSIATICQYQGYDLLSEQSFYGTLQPYQAVVLISDK